MQNSRWFSKSYFWTQNFRFLLYFEWAFLVSSRRNRASRRWNALVANILINLINKFIYFETSLMGFNLFLLRWRYFVIRLLLAAFMENSILLCYLNSLWAFQKLNYWWIYLKWEFNSRCVILLYQIKIHKDNQDSINMTFFASEYLRNVNDINRNV